MSKKPTPTPPALDRARAVAVAPYVIYGRTVALEQPRPDTADVLLFDANGDYIGERPGRKPAARNAYDFSHEKITVRVVDQPVDGPGCRAYFAGETFETTRAHAQLLGKLVAAVPAAVATATQPTN